MKQILAGLIIFILLATFLYVQPAQAQDEQEELTLSMSRDFGYSSGTGDIQGTFSMRIKGPAELNRVVFLLDGEQFGEDTEEPFKFQFNTDNYPLGVHTLSAVGYTTDGRELRCREVKANFVSADEGWQAALKLIIPILGLVLGVTALSFIIPLATGRKAKSLPLGTPRKYGLAGGTICSRCHRPFSINMLGPNMLVGKLDRCPHCGKWGIVRSYRLEDLRAAEAAELEMASGEAQVGGLSEEEKLRRDLDQSRYQDL